MSSNSQDFYSITSPSEFEKAALHLFKQQYHTNTVYRSYCDLINRNPSEIFHLDDIPFLPIQFFKSHTVRTFSERAEKVFLSSTTTGQTPSKHYVKNLSGYQKSFQKCFDLFYGSISDYTILALLPAYLERQDSSLIYMVHDMIQNSRKPLSGFYLDEWPDLIKTIQKLEQQKEKTLLIGVSFALLDLIEQEKFQLKHTVVMETGGMKGRRKEMVRTALHEQLAKGFGLSKIHSEYGMTELLSQAYSKGDGVFECPPWMRVRCRAPEDPFQILNHGRSGGLNIIDLANEHSCAFIATQDLGKTINDNQFEVHGRFDNAEIRGCNLLVL